MSYYYPPGGLPAQDQRLYAPARFTPAYVFAPAFVQTDIVTTPLPHWRAARFWVLARPLTGLAETFCQLIGELAPGGGCDRPEPDPEAEAVLFVVRGTPRLSLDGATHPLTPGAYAFLAPGTDWALDNPGPEPAAFHWIRRRWTPAPGVEPPGSFLTHDAEQPIRWMPGTNETWGTTRFVAADDIRHDMQVNIVTLKPGAAIPFAETHVMEHGLYVLQGRARYLLNTDWIETGPGDFMWLRAFCPQACEVSGAQTFRYLLYKDQNRLPALRLSSL